MKNSCSILKFLFLYIFFGCFICGCVNSSSVNTSTNKAAESEQLSSFEPFYVYEDFKSDKNHYLPSGWMGDVKNISMDLSCAEQSYAGNTSIKLVYKADGAQKWAGIYWQNPENNWGSKDGGYNLTGATKLTFWAKGAQGYEIISEAKIGGISGDFSDSDVAWLKRIKLTPNWKKYTINLSKSDLSYILGGFCIVFSSTDNPRGCTVYLDEIRYE